MPPWPDPVERVSRVLRSAAVDARIEELSSETGSAKAAAEAVGCDLGQIVKSVVLVCDGRYVVALVPGDRRADEAALASALEVRNVRVARADEVVEATGFEPGGVAPFPHLGVAQSVIDESLLAHQFVWIGAGTPTHLAALDPHDLQRLAGAKPVDLTPPG